MSKKSLNTMQNAQPAQYSLKSKTLHHLRAFFILACYFLAFFNYIADFIQSNYLSENLYSVFTLHKFCGLLLLLVLCVAVVNRFLFGFPYQVSDKPYEKLVKKAFFGLMYLQLFGIVTTGFVANNESNLVVINIFTVSSDFELIKQYSYILHTFMVKVTLPLMLAMHFTMAFARAFIDNKRFHPKMFRFNVKSESKHTLH